MSKIVITGIAGFIGFHTALRFVQQGWEVAGFDNFNEVIYKKDLKWDRAKYLGEHNIDKNTNQILLFIWQLMPVYVYQ